MSLFATADLPAEQIRDTLNAKIQHGHAYLRKDLPSRFHYGSDARVGDVLIVMEEPWRILPPKGGTRDMTVLGGWHGWDPSSPAMQGIFVAMGPGIKKETVVDRFEAVQVYGFLARLLGLKPALGVESPPSWADGVRVP